MSKVLCVLLVISCIAPCGQVGWRDRAMADSKTAGLVNPFSGDPTAAHAGAKLYARYCANCHGSDGLGLRRNPPIRTQAVMKTSPGALYWLLRNGNLSRGMPAWSYLPPQQRWQIIVWMTSEPKQQ